MINTYKIGASNFQILLTTRIKAFGNLTTSRAIVILLSDPNDLGTEVSVSADASGNILGSKIGDFKTLKGKRLSITTILSIIGTDEADRKTVADEVDAIYSLEKGDDGLKNYSTPLRSVNGDVTQVTLTLNIDLQ